MLLAFKIAWQYLLSSSTTSLLVILGSASGVALYIFMNSLLGAVSDKIVNSVVGSSYHIIVESKDKLPISIPLSDSVNISDIQKTSEKEAKLENINSLINILETSNYMKSYSPTVSGSGFATKGNQTNPINIRGIDEIKFKEILNLENKLIKGQYNLSAQNCLVGFQLAEDLGLEINSRLTIKSSKNITSSFIVSGIYDSGIKDINRKQVYMSIRDAQRMLDLTGYITAIEMQIKNVFDANKIALSLEKQTGLKVSSWMNDNAQVLSAIQGQNGSNSIIKMFTTISISFAIASILIVTSVQKSKEIGLLKSMGADTKTVMFIFIIQGFIIGILASLLGSVIAYLFIQLVLNLPFNQVVNGTRTIPVSPQISYFFEASAVITVIGCLASILPARIIAKLDPAEVMRNG